jgi:plasmid stability protein
MADLSIRKLDDEVHARLRVRAAANGRSMESEARAILTEAVRPHPAPDLFTTLRETFATLGGVELDLPDRSERARIVDVGS